MLRCCIILVVAFKTCFAVAQDLPELPQADVVILGETHDNGLHHAGQGAYLQRISPQAVVFEMLSDEQAEKVNSDPRTDMDLLGSRIGWENSGWPEFSLYEPVFSALGSAQAVAGGTDREDVRRSFSEGAAAVFGPDAVKFGIDRPLEANELNLRVALQFEAHCEKMPHEMMEGMVEAQRFRDATLANAILSAVNEYGGPVVLIAGSGHARKDWGVPALLRYAAPDLNVLSVAFVESEDPSNKDKFDIVIPTEPAEREDPCLAF